MLRVLKEVVRSDDAPRSLRRTAERHLWSRVEELQETYGFPFCSLESQFGVDLVQHAKAQKIGEAVVAYCGNKRVPLHEASSVLSKWQVFLPMIDNQDNNELVTCRVLVDGSISFKTFMISHRTTLHLLAEPMKMLKLDSSEEDKARAIVLLGGMCTKEAARAVLSYNVNLSHADAEVRAAVCRSLAWASEDDFAEHSEALVRTAFEDETSFVRDSAWMVLGLKQDLGVRLVEKQLAQGNYFDRGSDLLLRALFAVQWLGEDADVLWDDKVLQLIEDPDLWPAHTDTRSRLQDAAETLLKCGRMGRLTNILPNLLQECNHNERGQCLVFLAAAIKEPKPRIVDAILQLLVSVTQAEAWQQSWLNSLFISARALASEFNGEHLSSLLGVIEEGSSPLLLQLKASELLGELRKRRWDVSLPVTLVKNHFQDEDTTVLTFLCAVLQAWETVPEALLLLPHLAKLLQHSNESVKGAAFQTFGSFDAIPRLKPHIPALLSTCLGTGPETDIFREAFGAVQRLDIISNDLVDDEPKQKVLDSAHRLNDPDKKVQSRARKFVQLLPTDEIDSDLVKNITWTTFRKDDPLSLGTLFNRLGQKGQAALQTLLEEKPKELGFGRLLIWTIESIDRLQRDDPRAEALVYYMLNGSCAEGVQEASANALQRCFGKKTVELPGVAEALPSVAFKDLAPDGSEWLDRRVRLAQYGR